MATSMTPRNQRAIPEDLLKALKSDIESRRIDHGMSLLSAPNIFESFTPDLKNAAPFLSTLAQWCDSGYCEPDLLRKLVATYSKESRIELSIANYVHIRVAEGMLA